MDKFKRDDFVRHKLTDKLFVIYHIDSDRNGMYYHCAPVTGRDLCKPFLSLVVHSLDMYKQYALDQSAQVLYGQKQNS